MIACQTVTFDASTSATKAIETTESFLVREMNALSVQEREEVYAEIHGVNEYLEETPELIARSLAELREALRELPRAKRRVYDRLVFIRPGLLHDDKFLLLFLREVNFDVKNAVEIFLCHFECKEDLFGQEKLAKDITLDDLSVEDLSNFRTGGLHPVGKDRSGRTIKLCNLCHMVGKSYLACARAMFYILMQALLSEDDSLSKDGVVIVVSCIGLDEASKRAAMAYLLAASHRSTHSVPLRRYAFHFAYDDPSWKPIFACFNSSLSRNLRLRFRSHFGSALEVKYTLMTYGIVLNDFHLGRGDPSALREQCEQQISLAKKNEDAHSRKVLELENATGIIQVPTSNDCLMGRGKSYQDYDGNVRFSNLIDRYSERYSQCSDRLDKTVITIEVIQRVKEYGGRFLERIDLGWREGDHQTCRVKVSQALRFRVRRRWKAAYSKR